MQGGGEEGSERRRGRGVGRGFIQVGVEGGANEGVGGKLREGGERKWQRGRGIGGEATQERVVRGGLGNGMV